MHPQDEEARRKDQVSHHILRLAYCSSEEKRRWIIAQEVALFRFRLERETPEAVSDFMARHGLTFEPLSEGERDELAADLRMVWDATLRTDTDATAAAAAAEEAASFDKTAYFKVPFLQALELVKHRGVYLRKGLAYVPRPRITTIIVNRFRAYLSRSLAV